MADVATLPQNSPVMVDGVTVSVAGFVVQRPDGSLCRRGLDKNVLLPANAQTAGFPTAGSLHVELAPPFLPADREVG